MLKVYNATAKKMHHVTMYKVGIVWYSEVYHWFSEESQDFHS